LDKRKIHLEHPIKTVGEHNLELRLHAEVTTTLKLRIESTTPAALPAAPAPRQTEGKDGKEGAARTESRGHKRAERVREEVVAPAAEEKGQRPEKKARAPKAEKTAKPGKPAKDEKAEKAE